MREIKFQVYDQKLQMMFDVTEISRLDHSEGFIKGRKGDSGGEYYVTSGYLGKQIGLGPNGTAPIVNRFALREYTGLKDVNGKEIYEGDILKVPVDFNQEVHGSYTLHEVIIKNGVTITHYLISEKGKVLPRGYVAGFLLDSYEYDNKSFLFNDNPSMDTNVEIIGNIYENPELLEVAE